MSLQTTKDVRNLLLEAVQQVNAGSMDHKKAHSIIGLTAQILESARFEVEVHRLAHITGIKDIFDAKPVKLGDGKKS